MLTLAALDALLTISESELIDDLIVTLLAAPQLVVFFEKFPRLKQAITKDIPQWREQLKTRLNDTRLPRDLAEEVLLFRNIQLLSDGDFARQLPNILQQLSQQSSAFFPQASALVDNTPELTPALHTLFLQRWRFSLIIRATTLNQQLLAGEQDRLLSELLTRLQITRQLDPLLSESDRASGRLWDMTASSPITDHMPRLIQYADFLASQPELSRLAEQLGRSKEAKFIPKENAPPEMAHMLVREPATVPEQIEGIQRGDDILRLLPPELATLGISELEYEFYRRLLEKQLMTYRLQGDAWREKARQRPAAHQETDKQPRGPFIVCVDTSGSMGGFNEQCAKAFCLALMRIALADERRCFIMLFSSEIISYELTARDGLEQATRFLSQRFRGGTDLASCLKEIIKRMRDTQWLDADAVVISDFIAQRLPDDLVNDIHQHQQMYQHRFHAVAMSAHGKPGIMRIFDHIWRFDTGAGQRLRRRFRGKSE